MVNGERFTASSNPLAWPVNLAGDNGYRAAWIDDLLKHLSISPVIPSEANEDRDARGHEVSRESYGRRNTVEPAIRWRKKSPRVFSRFDKTAINYCGMIKMAMIERSPNFRVGLPSENVYSLSCVCAKYSCSVSEEALVR
jgi:hypothetical protein